MTAADARKFLLRENKLLEKLGLAALEEANASSGIEATIFKGWKDGFQRHHDVNEKLLGENDDVFDQMLKDEKTLLVNMRKAIPDDSGGFAPAWKAHLDEDISFIEELLK